MFCLTTHTCQQTCWANTRQGRWQSHWSAVSSLVCLVTSVHGRDWPDSSAPTANSVDKTKLSQSDSPPLAVISPALECDYTVSESWRSMNAAIHFPAVGVLAASVGGCVEHLLNVAIDCKPAAVTRCLVLSTSWRTWAILLWQLVDRENFHDIDLGSEFCFHAFDVSCECGGSPLSSLAIYAGFASICVDTQDTQASLARILSTNMYEVMVVLWDRVLACWLLLSVMGLHR